MIVIILFLFFFQCCMYLEIAACQMVYLIYVVILHIVPSTFHIVLSTFVPF